MRRKEKEGLGGRLGREFETGGPARRSKVMERRVVVLMMETVRGTVPEGMEKICSGLDGVDEAMVC